MTPLADLVQHEAPGLRRYATRFVRGTGVDTDDVLQEVWLRAHRALPADGSHRPWLYTVTRRCAIDAVRTARRSTGPEGLDDAVAPRSVVQEAEQRERLREVVEELGRLPPRQRRAIVGLVLEGRSHEHLATELRTTPAATRGLVARGRRALATRQALRAGDAVHLLHGRRPVG